LNYSSPRVNYASPRLNFSSPRLNYASPRLNYSSPRLNYSSRLVVVITPMPRYLDPCCAEHNDGRSEERMAEDRGKLLKAVWNLKRETFQLLVKQHCKNVIVISPMEVLGIKDSVEGVCSAMSDGIHLNKESLDKVVDHVIQSVEEHFVLKKRGPTEEAGPADKKPRFSSSSFESRRGGRRGAAGEGAGAAVSAPSARMGRTNGFDWKLVLSFLSVGNNVLLTRVFDAVGTAWKKVSNRPIDTLAVPY